MYFIRFTSSQDDYLIIFSDRCTVESNFTCEEGHENDLVLLLCHNDSVWIPRSNLGLLYLRLTQTQRTLKKKDTSFHFLNSFVRHYKKVKMSLDLLI